MKSAKSKRSGRKTSAQAKSRSVQPAVQAIVPAEIVEAVEATMVIEAPQICASAVIEESTETPAVLLPAHCGLRDAAALKASLSQVLDNERTVSVDTGAVERIDTAALQVLVSFVRERVAQARATEWRGLNENFLEAVHLLGLGPHLHLPAGAGAA